MPTSSKSRIDILHEDKYGWVSPSWLTEGDTSYAIRTIIRLDRRTYHPQTRLAKLIVGIAFVLVMACCWYLYRDILPTALAGSLLVASIVLMVYSAWYTVFAKSHYQVLITLFDGSRILLRRSTEKVVLGLHQGLTEAMAYHISDEFPFSADRVELKSSAENSKWQKQSGAEQSASRAASNRRARKLIPLLSILNQKRQD